MQIWIEKIVFGLKNGALIGAHRAKCSSGRKKKRTQQITFSAHPLDRWAPIAPRCPCFLVPLYDAFFYALSLILYDFAFVIWYNCNIGCFLGYWIFSKQNPVKRVFVHFLLVTIANCLRKKQRQILQIWRYWLRWISPTIILCAWKANTKFLNPTKCLRNL